MTTQAKSEPVPPSPVRPDPATLLTVLAGTFVAVLDFFIVNVAVPSIERDLHATAADIQFVVAGFAVAYGSGLIIGGRLGDLFGRRRMYTLGVGIFMLSSLVCGIAANPVMLIIGRIGQGLSAALLSPQVLSIIGTIYRGEARARAFNAYGVTMGLAAVFGQLIGGLLIQADILGWGWRSCFLINLPIGVLITVLAPRLVPESRAPGCPQLDLVGMVLIALALTAVVLPMVEGREQGWPLWTRLCLAGAVVLLAGFAGYEIRLKGRGGQPLVDPVLFTERAFTAGLLAQVVFCLGQAAFFLVFALYVQLGRGLDALGAGLIFVAIGAGYMATSLPARQVAGRLGRQVIAMGAALRLIAAICLIGTVSTIGTGGSIWWLVPSLFMDGAGMGFAVAPLASTVLSRMSPQRAGAVTGALTTGIQVGNALGVGIIGVVFYDALFGHGATSASYAHAFASALVYIAAVAIALCVVVQFMPPKGRAGL